MLQHWLLKLRHILVPFALVISRRRCRQCGDYALALRGPVEYATRTWTSLLSRADLFASLSLLLPHRRLFWILHQREISSTRCHHIGCLVDQVLEGTITVICCKANILDVWLQLRGHGHLALSSKRCLHLIPWKLIAFVWHITYRSNQPLLLLAHRVSKLRSYSLPSLSLLRRLGISCKEEVAWSTNGLLCFGLSCQGGWSLLFHI